MVFNLGGNSFGDVTVSPGWSVNRWNHIVLTADGVNAKLFVRGVQAYTVATALVSSVAAGDIVIGRDNPSANYTLNGGIDNVRIYNRALSASEVMRLYTEPFAGVFSPGYWMPGAAAAAASLVPYQPEYQRAPTFAI